MRSARASDRPSLLRRVALASGIAAALGGLIAATTAGLATRELVQSSDDARLTLAATRAAEELLEDDEEDEPPSEVLEEELDEAGFAGARFALRERGALVAGERSLPRLEPGVCAEVAGDPPAHACAVSAGERTLVVSASAVRAQAMQPLFTWGALLGVLFGSLAGALVSAGGARWALRPLDRLRAQIDAIDADAPRSDALSPAADHAEIEALRAAAADLVDRLGAALGNAQRFALDAAHELRTPLTTVAGELELLAEAGVSDAAALSRARASVDDVVALVQRLLVLAAPPVGATGAAEAVDLADVAAEVRALATPERASRVELSADDDVIVRGDPMLLRIALGNAIDNALKFSTGPVRVRIWADDGDAHVAVEDRGPGIAPAEQARVFEAFYRSAAARASAGGHGLGLAIIAHVAAGHGGSARFDEVERGARLHIVLPRWHER